MSSLTSVVLLLIAVVATASARPAGDNVVKSILEKGAAAGIIRIGNHNSEWYREPDYNNLVEKLKHSTWEVESSVLVKLGKPQIRCSVDRPYNYAKQKQMGSCATR
jgi:hypothetical protein